MPVIASDKRLYKRTDYTLVMITLGQKQNIRLSNNFIMTSKKMADNNTG